MIIKDLKIFLQNVRKNSSLIHTILKMCYNFNIIFIQEPSWTTLWSVPSSKSKEGEELVGVLSHPNWTTFSRSSLIKDDHPHIVSYINIKLLPLCFFLHTNIFNHRDILLISFFNDNSLFYLINIYSDSSQTALKYLKDTGVSINNVLIIMGDFNIHDSLWDPMYPFHSSHSDIIFDVADAFDLNLSIPTNHVPKTWVRRIW